MKGVQKMSALLEELAGQEEKTPGTVKTVKVEVKEPEGLGECVKSLFPHMDRAEAEAAFRRAVVEIMTEEESESEI